MRRFLVVIAAAAVVSLSACGDGDTPAPSGPQADDPMLQTGQEVFEQNCARCHGSGGEGGAGPRLAGGRVVERFPDPDDQAEVVRHGRGAMPAHDGVLTEEEIEAVVAYTREVL